MECLTSIQLYWRYSHMRGYLGLKIAITKNCYFAVTCHRKKEIKEIEYQALIIIYQLAAPNRETWTNGLPFSSQSSLPLWGVASKELEMSWLISFHMETGGVGEANSNNICMV